MKSRVQRFSRQYSTIDVSGFLFENLLSNDYEMNDMCIVDSVIYFCGSHSANGMVWAMIGYMPINTCNVRTHDIQGMSCNTFLTDLAVYKLANGDYNLVALGASLYDPSGYPGIVLDNCPDNLVHYTQQANYSAYAEQFVMEASFSSPTSIPVNYNVKMLGGVQGKEEIDDVVLTDNYVAFVGIRPVGDVSQLTIRRCKRNNVLADFDNYFYFVEDNDYKWLFPKACPMKGDTIGIVMLGDDVGNGYSNKSVVVDLPSQAMISHQHIDNGSEKLIPEDVVYMSTDHILVMVEDCEIGGVVRSVFHNLKPYDASSPYNADCFYESHVGNRCFHSMDRLTDGESFVAMGGDYWIMKVARNTVANASCYVMLRKNVFNKSVFISKQGRYDPIDCIASFDRPIVIPICQIPPLGNDCMVP